MDKREQYVYSKTLQEGVRKARKGKKLDAFSTQQLITKAETNVRELNAPRQVPVPHHIGIRAPQDTVSLRVSQPVPPQQQVPNPHTRPNEPRPSSPVVEEQIEQPAPADIRNAFKKKKKDATEEFSFYS
jgi:hypothetical protein